MNTQNKNQQNGNQLPCFPLDLSMGILIPNPPILTCHICPIVEKNLDLTRLK